MQWRAQVFSRKVKQHEYFKMCLEDLGLTVLGIFAADKDEMISLLKHDKPDCAIIPSDYWGDVTAYQIGVLHKRIPKVKIVIINMIDLSVKEACDFMIYGATSYVNFLCGQKEFNFGLKEVCNGNTFISSDVKGKYTKHKNNFNQITTTEVAILKQHFKGEENETIADFLHMSVNTVMTHKKNITRKLKVNKIGKAVYIAIQLGLINPYEKENFPSLTA
jgi:DNA-binding NarL/FixJ family response regulator